VVEAHTTPHAGRPNTTIRTQSGKLFLWDRDNYKATIAISTHAAFLYFQQAIARQAVRLAPRRYQTPRSESHKDARPASSHRKPSPPRTLAVRQTRRHRQPCSRYTSYPDDERSHMSRNIGPKAVASRAWVWRSIQAKGGASPSGSDWPVVTTRSLAGVQTALTA